jgi:(2Fe-2S) ferredoxin
MAEKLKSRDALRELRAANEARAEQNRKDGGLVVAVGMATCGVAAGAGVVYEIIEGGVKAAGLANVKVIATGCFGNCYAEPVVEVREASMPMGTGVRYGYVDAARANEIVEKHLVRGELVGDAIVGQEVRTL